MKLIRKWPFVERHGTKEARLALEQSVRKRPKVDNLVSELIRRGDENHFAERMARALEGR